MSDAHDPAAHWQGTYTRKATDQVSWFQHQPAWSLGAIARSIDAAPDDRPARVLDAGSGASTLIDALLDRFGDRIDLTALDIAPAALSAARDRLGPARAARVRWVQADLTAPWRPDAPVDVWHDRAVLHFMTTPDTQRAYLDNLRGALTLGGHAVLATFAPDGPTRCSGLPVQRYDADQLSALLGDAFRRVEHAREQHTTPWGSAQAFCCARFERIA